MKNKEKTITIPETRERIGQYIWNAMAQADRWESPDGNPLFFISDEDLLEIIENYNK